MGCTESQDFGFNELCTSIPGLLVDKDDQKLFYSLCKLESPGTISNILTPSSTQLFYVVVSGEVNVLLLGPGIKIITAMTFMEGETIHFFNAKLRCPSLTNVYSEFGECLRNDYIKLSLRFASSHGRVIGMNRRGFDEFTLKASANIHAITSFVSMNMADLFLISPVFQTMTTEQAYMFGPLLKLRLAHTGKEVGAHLPPPPLQYALTPVRDSEKCAASSHTERGHLIMLLHGGLMSVPVRSNIQAIAEKLTRQTSSAGLSDLKMQPACSVPQVFRSTGNPDRHKLLAWQTGPRVPARSRSRDAVGCSSSATSTVHESSHVSLPRGSIIGSDQYFVNNPDMRIRSYLTTAPSLLGYLPMAAMDALCQVDERFKRVYSRNMFLQIIHWVRPHVPFLADMDDWSLILLSCKVALEGKNTGEQVLRKGDAGNYAYIVLTGAVKRTTGVPTDIPRVSPPSNTEDHVASADATTATTGTVGTARSGRVLKWGSLIGVTALTTGDPYYHNAFAIEPTLLLCMGKGVLDQIYYNDKAKLCEVRIRLMGTEVDLLHAIDHPTGSVLFLQYLTNQLAAENFTFYKAVDRYDSLRRSVVKLNKCIVELQQQLQQLSKADDASTGTAPIAHHQDTAMVHVDNAEQNEEGCNSHPDLAATDKQISAGINTDTTEANSNCPRGTQPSHSQQGQSPRSAFSNRITAALSSGTRKSEMASPPEHLDIGVGMRHNEPEHFSFRIASALSAGNHEASDSEHMSEPDSTSLPIRKMDTATAELQHTDPTASRALDSRKHHHSREEGHTQEPRTRKDFLLAKAARIRAAYDQQAAIEKASSGLPQTYSDAKSSDGEEEEEEEEEQLLTTVSSLCIAPTLPTESKGALARPVLAKFRRCLSKLRSKKQSLQQYIAELLPTARAIMQTYIQDGAQRQINLSHAVRVRCEERYHAWQKAVDMLTSTVEGGESIKAADTDIVPEVLDTATAADMCDIVHTVCAQSIDLSFLELFKEAKSEVLRLLRDGMFPRWKNTPEFRSFIAGIKPYKAAESSVAWCKATQEQDDAEEVGGRSRTDTWTMIYPAAA